MQIKNHEYYQDEVSSQAITTVESNSTPRGRIYDRNGKLLVDNKPVKIISYKKTINFNSSCSNCKCNCWDLWSDK